MSGIRRKLKWVFKTEKINMIAFKALQMAIIQDMLNNGKSPAEIREYVEGLGRYFGDLLYIDYHARGGEVARSIADIGKIANLFYISLFGETLDQIHYSFDEKSNSICLHLIAHDGFPTCRGMVSPHPNIKLGAFIVGGINRMLELKKGELEYKEAYSWEEECVSAGGNRCEIIIKFVVDSSAYKRIVSRIGGGKSVE